MTSSLTKTPSKSVLHTGWPDFRRIDYENASLPRQQSVCVCQKGDRTPNLGAEHNHLSKEESKAPAAIHFSVL